jgi:hypothetical protein
MAKMTAEMMITAVRCLEPSSGRRSTCLDTALDLVPWPDVRGSVTGRLIAEE